MLLSSLVTRRHIGLVLLPIVLFWYLKNLPAIVSSPGTIVGAHIGMVGWVFLLAFLLIAKSSGGSVSSAARVGEIMGYGLYVLVIGVLFFGYQAEPLRKTDPRREMLRQMDVPFDPYKATDEEVDSFLKEMSPPAQAEAPSDEWLEAFASCIIANLTPETYRQIRSQSIVRLTEDFAKAVPGYCASIAMPNQLKP